MGRCSLWQRRVQRNGKGHPPSEPLCLRHLFHDAPHHGVPPLRELRKAMGEHTGPLQCTDGVSAQHGAHCLRVSQTCTAPHPHPILVLEGPWIFWVRSPVLPGCSHLSPWLRGDMSLDLVSISVSLSALVSPSASHVALIFTCLSCSPAVSHKPRTSRNLLRTMPCQ